MNMPAEAMLRDVQLDDKYTADQGQVYMTGTQALVRLPLMQRRRDLAAGLNTGATSAAIGDRRLVPTTRRCGAPKSILMSITCALFLGSMKIWRPPQSGERSSCISFRVRSTTACFQSGTGKGRALIEPAMPSATRIRRAAPSTVG